VEFQPAATCPIWLAFLERIMAGNPDLLAFLQRAVGFTLTGSVREHVLLFCYGGGANGKSTFLNTLIALLGGEYSMKAPPDLLMARGGEAHPTERADLFGRRCVVCNEADDGRRLAESLVKELTGGDSIRARRMREDFWEFNATHKLWLAANHKPIVRGTDHGIWRRIKLIPFTVTIPDDEQDKALPAKLEGELSGILNWALAGCIEWQETGLAPPADVATATSHYQQAMDVMGQFLEQRCVTAGGAEAGATSLYRAYRDWCVATGEHSLNQTRFGTELTERGFKTDRRTHGVVRLGIGLLASQNEREMHPDEASNEANSE
jgi:putative DNA primase/helicase